MNNKAVELLLQIQQRAVERIHAVLLWSLMVAVPGLTLVSYAGMIGVLIGLLLASATTMALMLWTQREIARIAGEIALLYALVGRVVEFHVPDWHVVGAE